MTVISLINGKGGVGRTTSAINLAYYMAKKKKTCLIVDMDPEGNATFTLGQERSEKNFFECITKINPKIDLVNSGECVEAFERKASAIGPSGLTLLKQTLKTYKKTYDYILIDTASATNQLLFNSIIASDHCLLVCESNISSLEGIVRMYEIIQKLDTDLNIKVNVIGILLTMLKEQTKHDLFMIQSILESPVGDLLLNSKISQSIVVKESAHNKKFIGEHKPKSKIALQYEKACNELLRKIQKVKK